MMNVQARLEALARRPRLQQRLLHQVVGKVAASGQGAAEGAQVRDYRSKLVLELRVGERNQLLWGPVSRFMISLCGHHSPSHLLARRLGNGR